MLRHLMCMCAIALGSPVLGSAPTASDRPQTRPETRDVIRVAQTNFSPSRSIRPLLRPNTRPVSTSTPAQPVLSQRNPSGFSRWVSSFDARAARAGISQRTRSAALSSLRYLPDVIERDRNQSEFTKTLWDYLDTAVSDTRVRNGRAALRKHGRLLEQIERTYGVPKEVVLAVWGLESAYGSFRGSTHTLSALATLAYDGRRARFFEAELINALKIIDAGDVSPRKMEGSWAGAMGHTQFMPSSYLRYAVDITGDGKRDIWDDNPADALASTANYLRQHGWQQGVPWGVEVTLPRGFDYSLTGERTKKSPSEWSRLGVRTVQGRNIPNAGQASILVPAGAGRAAFAIYRNFQVIERYNPADAYVIAVGHLSDRIGGGPAIQGSWPRGDRALKGNERRELQQRLRSAGFDPGAVDGKIGPNTLAAVRAYQRSRGDVVDGYVSLSLLQELRRR